MVEKLLRIAKGIGTHLLQQFSSLIMLLGCMIVGWLVIFSIIFAVLFVMLDVLHLKM